MIMGIFQKVKLGDILEALIDYRGKTPKKIKFGIPLITAKIVKNGFIDEPKEFIAESDYNSWMTRGLPQIGDIVLTTEAPLGEVAKIKNSKIALAQRIVTLRGKQGMLSNDYLKYFLTSPVGQGRLKERGTGTTVLGIKQSELRLVEVDLPDFQTQIRIASVLSAYDDLIENNEKRIKALEEMAQLLYTEWFVKFKFPGHEKVKMVDSGTEYGMVPEGWEVKRLKDVGRVVTGKTPPTSNLENFDGEVLFIKTPDVHGNIFVLETEQTLSEIGASTQSLKLLPAKTVFVSCIGTLGAVGITSKTSQTNQQINALMLNDNSDYCFFYLFAKSLKQRLVGLGSNGATMGNVNKDKFENINIVYPREEIKNLFFKATANLFDEILSLQKHNKNLSKTRDFLIPQLVTGKRELKNDL